MHPVLALTAPVVALSLLVPTTSAPTSGTDTTDGVAAVTNTPPVAVDDTAEVAAGEAVTIDVLGNDTDDGLGRPEGEPPRLEVVGATGGGRVTWTADSVTFTARWSDAGPSTFDYVVTDGGLTDTGTVTVSVAALPPRSVSLTSEPILALRPTTLRGRVAPGSAGRATVTLQRRTGATWKKVGTDRTDASGRFSVGYSTNRLGKRVFRARAVFADGPKATSAVLRRTVQAVPDAKVSGPLTAAGVPWSYRAGCPVGPGGLRRVTISYYSYAKTIRRGSIVVRAGTVATIVDVFSSALRKRFPVRGMKPADAFYAGGTRTPTQSDIAAMRAGNTSAFNCRPVTGNPYRVSQHSYGNAIDVNTIENPYVVGSRVYPSASRRYLDRSPYRRGMILRGGVVASRFAAHGWPWGARWNDPDYQHFSSNGG